MTDKPIDQFKQEVEQKKQHEFDTKLSAVKAERDQFKLRYEDLLGDYNTFRDQCHWLDALAVEYAPGLAIEPKSKTGTGEGVVVAVGSDWHVYETIKPERVNGLNEYNPKIAEASVKEFFQGVLAWTNIHRGQLKVKTLVLALLGDLVTNMLYDDMKEENAGPVQEEVLFALGLICQGIDMLLEHGEFDEIIVVCCDGNHSRDTKEQRASGRSQHTYEWLMYHFLSKFIYVNNPKVRFQVAEGYHNFLKIYDWNVRFHHGDWIRYMGGIGGLTIPMNKAIKSWNVGRHADFDIFAHWHQTMNPGLFYSNGSLLGYSPFAVKVKGEFEKPQQGLLVTDSKRFITSVNRIYVR
jgi:hypothetical protein